MGAWTRSTAGADRVSGKTLYGLQYLRALAATAVVCFHAAARAGVPLTVGEAGVDLFFLLSGFLMVSITREGTRPASFLIDRARRVAPPYWIATTVFLLGALAGLFPGARLDGWHVASSYLFLPSRLPGTDLIWPLLVPGWTLNYEMAFYALFALTLVLPGRWRLPVLSAVLFAAMVLGALMRPQATAALFYSQPIVLEFAVGAWCGWWWKKGGGWPNGRAMIAAAVLLFVYVGWLGTDAWRIVVFGVPALVLFTGVLWFERRQAVVRHEWLKRVGDASYSIYLWHTMVLSVTTKVATLLHLPTAVTIAVGIVAGVGGGIVAYRLVETPLEAWLKPLTDRLKGAGAAR